MYSRSEMTQRMCNRCQRCSPTYQSRHLLARHRFLRPHQSLLLLLLLLLLLPLRHHQCLLLIPRLLSGTACLRF
jgi:hypothetical protein